MQRQRWSMAHIRILIAAVLTSFLSLALVYTTLPHVAAIIFACGGTAAIWFLVATWDFRR